jgi:hypothetical protein
MTPEQAISKMTPPSKKRPHIWKQGVMQIWITRSCDLSCRNCTQGSNLKGKNPAITVQQFSDALDSLQGYFGVIGMFGGNPAIHPQFEELCAVMREKVPFEQRGLWCNHPRGKGAIMRETFNPAVSNLNVHQVQSAYEEFLRDWPELRKFTKDNLKGLSGDSRHVPWTTAMQDLIPSEEERWKLIADCDINKNWSAIITVFRGELRAFFCEIAGAQAVLHQDNPDYPDTGMAVVPGWWERPMLDFSEQVKYHCHACGIPLKGYGALANGGDGAAQQYTQTHADIVQLRIPDHTKQHVTEVAQVASKQVPRATDYIQNGT